MADFNIPAGTTQTVSSLSGTNTVEGNSTAAYGAGGGTLSVTGNITSSTLTVTGGILEVGGSANSATITLNNSTLNAAGSTGWDFFTTIFFGTGSCGVIVPPSDATLPDLGGVNISGMTSGDYISTGLSGAITNVSYASGTLSFTQGGVNYALSVGASPTNFVAAVVNGMPVVEDAPACLLRGSRVTTPGGPVAVERLAIGDLVTVASGEARPIKWIGRRAYAAAFVRRNLGLLPVCFRAGSLGPGVPMRDLYVSPTHAMFMDGLLIHAAELVNGRSVMLVTQPMELEYFHVELDRHAVIFAEGASTESYTDCGNRQIFQNAHEYYERHGADDDAARWNFCAPLIDGGPLADAARARLAAAAGLPLAADETAPGRLLGFVDHVGRDHVAGWASDEQSPTVPQLLEILEDGARLASILADRYRPDLVAAGIGAGRHGFRVAIPPSDRAIRRIDVRRTNDRALLPGSHASTQREAA
jgi:hypothetical protein